jgi:PIN domain nuclease of toxin-antitoxin system
VSDGGFLELPVTFEHAEAVRELPLHHSDPFDRLIIAAAVVEGCSIVTSDEKFRMYDVTLIDARR